MSKQNRAFVLLLIKPMDGLDQRIPSGTSADPVQGIRRISPPGDYRRVVDRIGWQVLRRVRRVGRAGGSRLDSARRLVATPSPTCTWTVRVTTTG